MFKILHYLTKIKLKVAFVLVVLSFSKLSDKLEHIMSTQKSAKLISLFTIFGTFLVKEELNM